MRFVTPPQVFSVGKAQQAANFSALYRPDVTLPDYTMRFIQIVKELMSMESTRDFEQK